MSRIFIHDELPPEASAMLQALYSRSPESVATHIDKVRQQGSARFMESYYVGYGHASIGDCGTTTLYFEGVSILAAKAIQDNPLYSGQETSTRYIDFSRQGLHDPVNTPESAALLRAWIDFYVAALEPLLEHLRQQHPREPGQNLSLWDKAIRARGFDILRSLLPAGVHTQLSWSTNLRQAHERLTLLRHHPLDEVRDLAERALTSLAERYPSSFGHRPQPDRDAYLQQHQLALHYFDEPAAPADGFSYQTSVNNDQLEAAALSWIAERPPRANLPRLLARFGHYHCQFLLDYGSFRDLQRHRNGWCPIPLLRPDHGFHPWYLDQMPAFLREQAEQLLREQLKKLCQLQQHHGFSDAARQYFLPLGLRIVGELVYDLPEMVYVTELRSSSTVHPTLRQLAHAMHQALVKTHPQLRLYTDLSPDPWDIRRGAQDIVRLDPAS